MLIQLLRAARDHILFFHCNCRFLKSITVYGSEIQKKYCHSNGQLYLKLLLRSRATINFTATATGYVCKNCHCRWSLLVIMAIGTGRGQYLWP